MASPEEERDWISRSQQGDAAAFGALVREYQRMIHSVTFRMTGSMADSEDLAQEAFVRAYEQVGAFRSESKFSTWLCRIAVNACLSWRKRENRRQYVHDQWALDNLQQADQAPEINDPDKSWQRIQSALNRLPAKQRAAIVLTVYENMSHAEAAHALGCAETTVSWRLFAARGKLKRWLGPR